ncbi:MAG: autotransporter-associated beta strand repeat-containing protein [Kiritimatiellae bacterium]|nr:autotransporter-associated beta strand repeat-containing protein [Kiritimatiellia bacterium]
MNRNIAYCCAFVFACFVSQGMAADGVWTNQVNGNWSDTANWENGAIAGSGGVATFNLTGTSYRVSNDLGTVSLSGVTLTASIASQLVTIAGGTNEIIAPAVINASNSSYLSFKNTTLLSSTNLLITGSGRLFLGYDNLLYGRTIISNGNVRAFNDSAFGPAPTALDADAITLDGGGLMNDANDRTLTITPNRGITLTANGGYIGAGYINAETEISSPITGPGFLGINYEHSLVILGNSTNDYTGGTQIGTQGPGVSVGPSARLQLSQNEVIPDAGGLIIAGDTAFTNTLPAGILDLNGKTESVDTLSSGPRATITSSVADQGKLVVGSQNDDSSYNGTITGGATLEKQGIGNLDLDGASLTDAGTIDLRAGVVQAGGPNLGSTTVLFNGGYLEIVAPDEPHILAAGEANVLNARMLLETNATLAVDANAGTFVFSGIATTNSVQTPEPTLTINNSNAPVFFGSSDVLSPAVLDADIASSGGLVLTNNVWLRRLPAESYILADNVNMFLDGNDQLNGGLVLSNFSATVVANTILGGDGTVTVLNGNTLSFSTLQFVDGWLQDGPENSLTMTNDFSLNDSTAVFTGEGVMTYIGDFSGTGTVEKHGSGTTLLTSSDSSLTGDIVIYDGILEAGSEDVLAGADVTLAGGALSNVDGDDLTLSSTEFTAQSGGFYVTSNDAITIESKVTGDGSIAKTGEGTLILSGTTINTNLALAVSSGSLELNKTGVADAYAVDALDVADGASVLLTGSNGNQINGAVTLSGGTLDIGGKNEVVGALSSAYSGSTVVNNGAAATLSVGAGDQDFGFVGTLNDGTGALSLTKVGAGTMTINAGSILYSGGTDVDAGTLRLMPALLPDIDGLSYQLDAVNSDTITLAGSKVAAWADSSAAGVDFSQGNTSLQPEYVQNAINGLPAISFSADIDAGLRNRMAASKSATAQTVFIVAKTTSFGEHDGIWGHSVGDYGIRGDALGTWAYPGDDGDFTQYGTMYINGTSGQNYNPAEPYILTAARSTAYSESTHAIGDYWNSATYVRSFRGYIGEVLVYNRALSTAERETVEAYLSDKWFGELPPGIAYQLDASDPSTITLDGSNVTAWADATSSGVNFSQGDSAQQPVYVENAINGLPAVRFGINGTTRMVANKSVTARTVFIVSEMKTPVSLAGVWGQSGQDKGARHANSTSWRHTGNNADEGDFTNNGMMRINGVPGFSWGSEPLHIMSGVSTSDKIWTTAIGNYWAAGSYGVVRYFRGYIGEILVYNRALNTADLERVEAYLSKKWLGYEIGSETDYALTPVTIASGAQFAVNDRDLKVGELSGTGDLAVESGYVAVTNYAGFTGAVFGDGTLALASDDGADASFIPRSLGVTILNDGTMAADLVIDSTETNLFLVGALADGLNTLGLIHSGSGTTLMSGLNSTYTGDTSIENGVASVGSIAYAQYVRFFPQMMRETEDAGQHPNSGYQISEFQIMLNGEKVEYPAGTQATSPGINPDGNEGPMKAIDGITSTKFYTGDPSKPLVIELPTPTLFNGYSWTTANDANGRDPVVWVVDISDDGVNWTTVDYQDYSASQGDITKSRQTEVGTWSMNVGSDMNVLSDMSATTVAAPGELSISSTTETVGALSGDGTISLTDGTLGINAFTNAIFSGNISGSGSIVKWGSETQTLSCALSVVGEIVVEAGVLDLEGAVLTGITNIVIKTGGELTGAATVNNDLTVTFEGGIYSGTLAVSDSLTTSGTVNLAVPEGANYPFSQLLFSYVSADQATLDALSAAVVTTLLPPGQNANVRVDDTSARLMVAPAGLLIILR